MKDQITIREAVTEHDVKTFWDQIYDYYKRDIMADLRIADREEFLSSDFRTHLQSVHDREQDRCRYLFFRRDGRDIGFALPVIYTSEDGKCFIMEFCVYPEFRGNGTGRECVRVLWNWAEEHGARYGELNFGGDERRRRFWESVGFCLNGVDQWGDPLMMLPPKDTVPVTVEIFSDPEDWQLRKLENGFLKEIGEEPLTEEKQKWLFQAIRDGKITFFAAKRGYRAVGICSVAKNFSTFACSDTGVFEDFYVEPVFRGKGIARKLAEAAQTWCREKGIASLTVTCAPCDEQMYQSLGFEMQLGTTFAHVP